jgi:hypothetical protein
MDHHAKLAWASKHLDAFESATRDFADSQPYRVVRNFNAQTREHEASVIDVKPTPPDWSLMVGDIVHELRSALDNLTYALAVKESGSAKADASTRIQFPIADTLEGWAVTPKKPACQKDRIVLLSKTAQAVVERLQPCNRPDKSVPHPLSTLRDLSNRDKHKRLVIVLVKAMDVDLTITGTGLPAGTKIRSTFRGPLEENTVIAVWSFTPPITPPDMDVNCDSLIAVEFGDDGPAPRQYVWGILTFICNYIRDEVFVPLDKLLV